METNKEPSPEAAMELSSALLKEWDGKNINPTVAYAALGCAFFQLHLALGKDKKEWLDLTKEMAEISQFMS